MSLQVTPSVHEYAMAFNAIRDELSAGQLRILERHHDQPARAASASALARLVDFQNFNGVNLQYGKVATLVAEQLGFTSQDLDGVMICILVEFVKPADTERRDWILVMRPQVARALEQLGWVHDTSAYLFPDEAARVLGLQPLH